LYHFHKTLGLTPVQAFSQLDDQPYKQCQQQQVFANLQTIKRNCAQMKSDMACLVLTVPNQLQQLNVVNNRCLLLHSSRMATLPC
jgi:hypothetical protein